MTLLTKADWDTYLATRPLAKELWATLSYYVKDLPIPAAGPLSEDDVECGMQFVWDVENNHFEVDINHNKDIEWFYWNRDTDGSIGGECTLTCITVDLLSKLYLIAGITKPRSTMAAEVIGASEGKTGEQVIEEGLNDMRKTTSINEEWLAALANGCEWHGSMPPAGRPTGKPIGKPANKPLTEARSVVSVMWSLVKSFFNNK